MDSPNSRLSICAIIPAYNAARFIGRALDSVFAQTRPASQVIVIDDGSKDDLESALIPYRGRITFLKQEHSGPSAARNAGLEIVQCDLIAFLDADDFWEPNKLETQARWFENEPELVFSTSAWYIQIPGKERVLVDDFRKPPRRGFLPWWAKPYDYAVFDSVRTFHGAEALLIAHRYSTTPAVMLRWRSCSHFRFDPKLPNHEDTNMWFQCLQGRKVVVISEPLVTLVFEPGSISRRTEGCYLYPFYQMLSDRRETLGDEGYRMWEIEAHRRTAGFCLKKLDFNGALKYALLRQKCQPLSMEGLFVILKTLWKRTLAGLIGKDRA